MSKLGESGREEEPLAIASMHVKIISRGKGRSAVRSAVYRSGEKIYCEYTDKTYSYPRKQEEVIHTEIVSSQYSGAAWQQNPD